MTSLTPLSILMIAALVPAVLGLGVAWSCRGRRSALSWMSRALLAGLLLALAALGALLGLSMLGYARLLKDAEVATLSVRQLGEQHFELQLNAAGRDPQRFDLRGDQWQLDARVLRWKLPAAIAGAPPLYRLERLSGRYEDIRREREAVRSVHALSAQDFPDLWTLRRQFPQWLAFVDADYGSAAYLPLLDGARFNVSLSPRGGLVAQAADEETEQLLDAAGW